MPKTNVVDVPEPISRWLASYAQLSTQTPVLNAAGSSICQHSAKEWSDVRNGYALGQVLSAFFRAHGQQSIIPKLRQGDELKVR